jgi:hypothetical protein
MKQFLNKPIAIASLLLIAMQCALAQLPKRDLTIELRQVEEAQSAGYTVSTKSSTPLLLPQSVQVRNGEKASLNVSQTMTLQWVKSVQAQSASLTASGTTASSNYGGVSHGIMTMKSGQTFKVHPSWPGPKQMATIAVEVESDTVEGRNGAELPNQSHSEFVTTVTAAFGQWVTIATTGAGQSQQLGVYSTNSVSEAKRFLQIRVVAP